MSDHLPASATVELPAEAIAVRTARAFCSRTLSDSAWAARSDTAELLLGELVANAVLHARSASTVEIAWNTHLRVSVSDRSPALPEVQDFDPRAISGRGLQFVDRLADRYGVEANATGKTVWFELDHTIS